MDSITQCIQTGLSRFHGINVPEGSGGIRPLCQVLPHNAVGGGRIGFKDPEADAPNWRLTSCLSSTPRKGLFSQLPSGWCRRVQQAKRLGNPSATFFRWKRWGERYSLFAKLADRANTRPLTVRRPSLSSRRAALSAQTPRNPGRNDGIHRGNSTAFAICMVGTGRLELPTSTLSEWRSNQLSYAPASNHFTAPSTARGQIRGHSAVNRP